MPPTAKPPTPPASNGDAAAAAQAAAAEAAAKDAAAKDAAAAQAAAEADALQAAIVEAAKLTAAPEVRPPAYRVPDAAKRAKFGKQTIAVGVNVKSGIAHYVLENGTVQVGFPTGAIAVAILTGIISRETIKTLWAAADAAAA
jgi:hypothetical protein